MFSFGYDCSTKYKPIDYYVDGLEVAIGGATQEVHMSYWTHSKNSLQRLVKAGAEAKRFIVYQSKMDLDSELDFSGPDYKIEVRNKEILKSLGIVHIYLVWRYWG